MDASQLTNIWAIFFAWIVKGCNSEVSCMPSCIISIPFGDVRWIGLFSQKNS